jgi:hypothetical protein
VNVNTTAAQSRLCDPCGVGPGCRLPPVFLNRNRTERSDRSTGTGTVHVGSSCAVRVPLCVRVSRVCPGSPRCLFTGTVLYSTGTGTCVSRLPPLSFYRYMCVPAPPGVFLPVHVL